MDSWDALYATELANNAHDPRDRGTSWFDDSHAQEKTCRFLASLATADQDGIGLPRLDPETTSFLDVGCGNGAMLRALRYGAAWEDDDNGEDEGETEDGTVRWNGPMLGIDYSAESVALARQIGRSLTGSEVVRRSKDQRGRLKETSSTDKTATTEASGQPDAAPRNPMKRMWEEPVEEAKQKWREAVAEQQQQQHPDLTDEEQEDILFLQHDIFVPPANDHDAALLRGPEGRGWDVVLDKGTFDAVSLAADEDYSGRRRRCEAYGDAVLRLVRAGGLFLVTSCNWTEGELCAWFERDGLSEDGFRFAKVGRIEYKSFSFGGKAGQTVSSVCFRKGKR